MFYSCFYLVARLQLLGIANGAAVVECNAIATRQQQLGVEALQLQAEALQQVFLIGQPAFDGNRQSARQHVYPMALVTHESQGKVGYERL